MATLGLSLVIRISRAAIGESDRMTLEFVKVAGGTAPWARCSLSDGRGR
jgi:hypothetical protein